MFTDKSPGQVIAITGGEHAFLPFPLPAGWEFPVDLWPQLSAARTKLALLEGIGRSLPNPGLLLRPLEDREAIQSSRLEGTYVTAKELLLFEFEPRDAAPGEIEVNNWREVFNCREALQFGMGTDLPLSLRLIRELHRRLMTGVRGQDKTPGEFRKQQVAIGQSRRFVPPSPNHLSECLDQLEKYIHAPGNLDPLITCFLCHYQFETIHPFSDGNGRVGRLLLALMIQQRCELTKPWLLLSEFFERRREEYCELLFKVSTQAAWTDWIRFCLEATEQQADKTISRCNQLQNIREEFKVRMQQVKGSNRLAQIVEDLFASPFIRVAELPKRLGISYPTAKADVERLVNAGILKQLKGVNPLTFFAPAVYQAAYADISDEDFEIDHDIQ